MRMILSIALTCTLIVCLAGCTRTPDDTVKPKSSKGTIGISVLTMTNPFFKEIADVLTEEVGKHGYDVIAVAGEKDIAKQQKQVQDFLVKKVAAIVLCPCDSKAIGSVIREANAAGVPVFTADIASLDKDAKVVTHVATDNYQGGKQAGEAIIEALGPAGGKVLLLDFNKVESCMLRVKGFKEVVYDPKVKSSISIVKELNSDGAEEVGFRATQDALQAHPDLAGIFAINDPAALGARAALEKANKTEQVKIVGFDGQPSGRKAIAEGKIYADPIQHPDKIGRETARSIIRFFKGEEVPKEILIPTNLYRKADGEKEFGGKK